MYTLLIINSEIVTNLLICCLPISYLVELEELRVLGKDFIFFLELRVELSLESWEESEEVLLDLVPSCNLSRRSVRVEEVEGEGGVVMENDLELDLWFSLR
jgi:hypothetical protein